MRTLGDLLPTMRETAAGVPRCAVLRLPNTCMQRWGPEIACHDSIAGVLESQGTQRWTAHFHCPTWQ